MKLLVLLLSLKLLLFSTELKVIADAFNADEAKGISEFSGHVKITKGSDELNASKVTIYIDKERHPIKYEAEGQLSFFIMTDSNATYRGHAQKGVFIPDEESYSFYGNVRLYQLDQKKTIIGDKVIVNMKKGTAAAEGGHKKPVIMTFELEEKQ
jgi:lipopolysaccharide export system protein LptA